LAAAAGERLRRRLPKPKKSPAPISCTLPALASRPRSQLRHVADSAGVLGTAATLTAVDFIIWMHPASAPDATVVVVSRPPEVAITATRQSRAEDSDGTLTALPSSANVAATLMRPTLDPSPPLLRGRLDTPVRSSGWHESLRVELGRKPAEKAACYRLSRSVTGVRIGGTNGGSCTPETTAAGLPSLRVPS
jgi:hypothetical protein